MSFIISGDTHGMLDIGKIVAFFDEHEGEYTSEDYLIICGDVGVCGFSASEEAETRSIFRDLPVTTLFIDGNHENFEQLNSYGVDTWNGGKVHFVESKIIHLMRGQVYEIDGTRFFTFGGACSIDKMYRTEGISWFPEEMPNRKEYEEGWQNLEKADFQVDYILTHSGPEDVVAAMGYGDEDEGELRRYLQNVADNTEFTAWYFGHFHEDTEIEDMFYCLYDDIVVL